ncbi:MAG: TRAP transporter substrate-binding protein [Actinomycetaceae bacterium]|nr:TRAP transporter substrate-binding protein [Actinomycetaceae bacterium]
MRRWLLQAFALVAAVSLAACGARGGTDTVDGGTLHLSINQTAEHPMTVALKGMSEGLFERTDGRWTLVIHPNEVLGAQREVIQLLQDDIVELAIVNGSQLENLNHDFRVFNLPFVFDDIDHQMKVVNNPEITDSLYKSLEGLNINVVAAYTGGERSLYTEQGPINTPSDIQGMKIRVQETDTNLRMIRQMSGSPTPMSYGEVYTALQAGVIDGAENNEVSYVQQKHYEVAKHWSYTRHLIIPDYLIVSHKMLERFTPEDRAIFDELLAKSVEDEVRLWNETTQEALVTMQEAGVTITEPDAEAFRTAIEPMINDSLTSEAMRELFDKTRQLAGGK